MPPITRQQSKKFSSKPEPYSRENCSIEKRSVLQDLVANNGVTVFDSTTTTDIKKSKNQIYKNCNIIKTENTNNYSQSKNEFSKTNDSKTNDTKTPKVCLSANNSEEITLYHSTIEHPNSKNIQKSEELYESAIDKTDRLSLGNNTSELFHSTVQDLSSNNCKGNIFEIDELNWNNFIYVGCYAQDIFKYFRHREEMFNICDYIGIQTEITSRHRAIVVNWLVNLQEIFGLNHEVLYMAVKLIDLYLMKNVVIKDQFQLLASGAILISNKIDIREQGFSYNLVKQSIFTEDELFVIEKEILKALNYDLNIPLSYVFLRRFARCMKCQMFLLTLARYILEYSLLDYTFVTSKESLKAAASLYLAFKMCLKSVDANEFNKVTAYSVKEIKNTVIALNNMLHTPIQDLCAVKQKYMHETFYEVASHPLLSNSKLGFN